MGIRLRQAGGVVFARDPVHGVRVLLVSDRHGAGRWLFPKGDIDEGETPAHAAQRETYEEAGVKTAIVRSVGSLAYSDGRFDIEIEFFLLRYRGESTETIERRKRRWVTFAAAAAQHHLGGRIGRIVRAAEAAARRALER